MDGLKNAPSKLTSHDSAITAIKAKVDKVDGEVKAALANLEGIKRLRQLNIEMASQYIEFMFGTGLMRMRGTALRLPWIP